MGDQDPRRRPGDLLAGRHVLVMHYVALVASLALVIGLTVRDPLLSPPTRAAAAFSWTTLGAVGFWRAWYVGESSIASICYFMTLTYVTICIVSLGRPAFVTGDLILDQMEAEGKDVPPELRKRIHKTQISVVSTLVAAIVLAEIVAPEI